MQRTGEVLTPEYQGDEIAAFAETGALTEGILTPFGVVSPEQLSQDGTLSLSVGIERTKNWLDAQQMRHLAYRAAHADVPPCAPKGEAQHYALMSLQREVACANRWSANMAAERIHTATVLATKLTATLDLMETGVLGYGYARVLVDAVDRLDDPDGKLTAKLEERVLKRAASQTYGEFRAAVRRGVAALDPRGLEEKHASDAEDRRVVEEPDENAMAWLKAFLPATDARTIMTAIQAVADMIKAAAKKAGVQDCRTADQLRSDALTAICSAVLNGERIDGLLAMRLPKWQGRRPNVNVTVSLATLLGMDDQAADLDGYGPIPADLARRIAADDSGTWHRLVTDELGHLIDYGQTVYRPPQDLKDFVIARDRTCTGIGCHRNAHRCDLDHVIEFENGGHTSVENLEPKCERDHYLKQHAGWDSERDNTTGTTTWTTPTGRSYENPAHEYPIDHTRPKTEPDDDPPPF